MDTTKLKVWSWFGRDQASGEDLQFMIAVGNRKELQRASVRLSLPSPEQAGRVPPSNPVYREAMADPPLPWSSEEELHDMRAARRRG